jgi:beta-glucosidase/6-phospho-beta-glucosidase/beta-galactosidase
MLWHGNWHQRLTGCRSRKTMSDYLEYRVQVCAGDYDKKIARNSVHNPEVLVVNCEFSSVN